MENLSDFRPTTVVAMKMATVSLEILSLGLGFLQPPMNFIPQPLIVLSVADFWPSIEHTYARTEVFEPRIEFIELCSLPSSLRRHVFDESNYFN